MEKTILGIDIGTSSIKCSLFNLDGKEVYALSSTYPTIRSGAGELEIDTEDIFSSLIGNIKDLLEETKERFSIEAIGLCAVMIMPVFLDSHDNVARPIIHWFDNRPYKQYEKLREQKKDLMIADLSGSSLTAEGTINSVLWVKENEPEVYKKTKRFFQLKDYARFRLTGDICTDYGDASGTQLFDSRNWKWNEPLISELGLKKSMFCNTKKPTEIAGTVTKEISLLTGLRQGIPVAVGSGDGITTIFGLGIFREGHTGITVGSAGVVATPSKTYPKDNDMRNYIFCHPFGDRWFSLMATASSGEVFKWYKENILKDTPKTLSELEDEAARSSVPGASGLTFLPYILGARNPLSDPKAYGVLLGMRHHHQRADITRAVLEGLSLEILDIIEAQKDIFRKIDLEVGDYKLSGGILKGTLWKNMLADIIGEDLTVTGSEELGCLGSAMYASVASGAYPDLKEAVSNMVKDKGVIKHDRKNIDTYSKKYSAFKKTYGLFKDRFDDLVI